MGRDPDLTAEINAKDDPVEISTELRTSITALARAIGSPTPTRHATLAIERLDGSINLDTEEGQFALFQHVRGVINEGRINPL